MPDDEIQESQVDPGQVEGDLSEEEYESYIDDSFLEGLSEVERKLLEPHLSSWDERVRNRVSEIQQYYEEQLSPYQGLNLQPQNLQEAATLYQHLESNPASVFYAIGQSLGYSAEQLQALSQGYTPQQVGAPENVPQQSQQQADPYSDFDPRIREFVQSQQEKSQQLEQTLNNVVQLILAQNQKQQQEVADAQLRMTLHNLREQYGDYDQEYVLTQMYNGKTPEQAIGAYQQMMNNLLQQAAQKSQQAPPVLSGNGAAPQETFDVKNASNKEVQNMIASLMQASANG